IHGIHGRAPGIATGLKAFRPDLHVWVVTGDGDALAIGGNHFIHAIRRNIGLKILMFNNRIYGLTKGQYSPTSELGKKTVSTPDGSIDRPFRPISLALGSEATFVARVPDNAAKLMPEIFTAAHHHNGTAFVEIYQNCPVFNDGAFAAVTDKKVRDESMLLLRHGEPMLFGHDKTKGIIMRKARLAVATVGEDGVTEADILVHDAHDPDPSIAFWLSRFDPPDFPVPVGVFRAVDHSTYEESMKAQIEVARERQGPGNLEALLTSGDTWVVQ
ncbi:MAG: thiamine pyrophosphate-dependent enzyme, partial [Myxococcota bacterium]